MIAEPAVGAVAVRLGGEAHVHRAPGEPRQGGVVEPARIEDLVVRVHAGQGPAGLGAEARRHLPALVERRAEARVLARGHQHVLLDAGPVGQGPLAAAVGTVERRRRADGDVHVVVARLDHFARRADGGHDGHADGGAAGAVHVVHQLVQVVGEGVLGVRALVELGEHVAADLQHRAGHAVAEVELHVVLPLDLVADMVLVPHAGRIPDGQLLVGVAERDGAGAAVQVGAARVAPVLVTEAAPGGRVHRRVPGRVELPVRSHDRVAVVNVRGAVVVGAGAPEVICHAHAGRDRWGGRARVVGARREGGGAEEEDGERAGRDGQGGVSHGSSAQWITSPTPNCTDEMLASLAMMAVVTVLSSVCSNWRSPASVYW